MGYIYFYPHQLVARDDICAEDVLLFTMRVSSSPEECLTLLLLLLVRRNYGGPQTHPLLVGIGHVENMPLLADDDERFIFFLFLGFVLVASRRRVMDDR